MCSTSLARWISHRMFQPPLVRFRCLVKWLTSGQPTRELDTRSRTWWKNKINSTCPKCLLHSIAILEYRYQKITTYYLIIYIYLLSISKCYQDEVWRFEAMRVLRWLEGWKNYEIETFRWSFQIDSRRVDLTSAGTTQWSATAFTLHRPA